MRHGETNANKKKLVQGQTNESLNKKGVLQIKNIIWKLKRDHISVILSSDLNRAKETSEIISKNLGLKVEYFRLLREKNNGLFTGKPSKLVSWDKIPESYEERRAPDGESLREVLSRVKKFLAIMKTRYNKERVLVISHGTFIKIIKGYLEGKDIQSSIEETKIKNAEAYKLKC